MATRLFGAALITAAVACGGSPDKAELESRILQLVSSAPDEFCAPWPQTLHAEAGYEDIEFDRVPGAHRVVLANATGGSWRMVTGYPALLVYSRAGFFKMTRTEIAAPDGAPVPAVQFELTRQGYEAMRGPDCFVYGRPKSVRILKIAEAEASDRLRGVGRSYRIDFVVEGERLPWARTPEFGYLAGGIYVMRSEQARSRTFLDTGKELLDEGAARAIAGGMKFETVRAIRGSPGEGASTAAASDAAAVAELLAKPQFRRQLAPCLDFPKGGPRLDGAYAKDSAEVSVRFEEGRGRDGRPDARAESALEFFRRLERAGDAAATHSFRQSAQGELWAGSRFVLDAALAAAVKQTPTKCIPLGESKVDSLSTYSKDRRIHFTGWAFVENPAPWAARLAAQFPGAAKALRDGFAFSGTYSPSQVHASSELLVQARAKVPQFGAKPRPSPAAFSGYSAERVRQFRQRAPGPVSVDMPGYEGQVRFNGKPPCVSEDGLTLSSSSNRLCGGALRISRGYTSGKVYAEISFSSEAPGGRPNTWTNAAFTNARGVSSVRSGAAQVSFAGTHDKHKLHPGDVVGIAADLDEGVIYYHVNGEWQTGLPGSELGRPVVDLGSEHFIAASAQGGPKEETEAWSVNVGQRPFRFAKPGDYNAYGETR